MVGFNESEVYKKLIEIIFMLSTESLQIQSYLFANKTAQSALGSLAEGRAWFDVMVEKYAGHPIPLRRNACRIGEGGRHPSGVDLSS